MSATEPDPALVPMPPPTSGHAAWLRPHSTLLLALGASITLHLIATVGTVGWLGDVERPHALHFNAVLSPLAATESTSTTVSVESARSRPTPRTSRMRTPRIPPSPKSEAAFVAPENAIAVERANSGGEADPSGSDDGSGENAVHATAVPIVTPTVTAPAELPPAAAEKPALPDAPVAIAEAPPQMELPSRVSIAYRATTAVADGVAHYRWRRDGEKYEFVSTIQAEGFFVNMFAGTLTQESTGSVTSRGLEPAFFTIRRGEGAAETAEFQRATQQVKLSRGSASRQLPMPPNLQDTQSFLFQLAIEAAKLKTPEDRLVILVTNARGLNSYTFRKAGDATLETRLGRIETVHLVRETSEPRDSYEAWLSPKHHYLPVKLKFFVDRFPAELIATNITSTP